VNKTVSFYTHTHGLNSSTGFGYCGLNIVQSLKSLGYRVPFGDPSAPLQINFTHPGNYADSPGSQYKIGYTPWESTALKEGWLDKMNLCDEIWTPSDLVAGWFANCGVRVPIKVYEHGVTTEWLPIKRTPTPQLNFFHHGGEANRKLAQLTVDAFIETFGKNNPAVALTFKSNGPVKARAEYPDGSIKNILKGSSNIRVISHELSQGEIVQLYNMHDVMIYCSAGEGFGMSPLQAMGSGMPVIMNTTWAPYRRFANPNLTVKDSLVRSSWGYEHPGSVLRPSFDDLCRAMAYTYDNFKEVADHAYDQAEQVHEEYNWVDLTDKMFTPLMKKLS